MAVVPGGAFPSPTPSPPGSKTLAPSGPRVFRFSDLWRLHASRPVGAPSFGQSITSGQSISVVPRSPRGLVLLLQYLQLLLLELLLLLKLLQLRLWRL